MRVDQSRLMGDVPGFVIGGDTFWFCSDDEWRSIPGEEGSDSDLKGESLESAGRVRPKFLQGSIWLPRGLERRVRNLLGRGLHSDLPKTDHTCKFPLRPCVPINVCVMTMWETKGRA